MKRSSRRLPRSSFVVTVALLGCGGQVSGINDPPTPDADAVDTARDGVTVDTARDGVTVDTARDGVTSETEGDSGPTTCPTSQPIAGDPCNVPPSSYCDYTKCGPSGGSGKAFQCIDRRWQEVPVATCNPPPVCPMTEPIPESPCSTGGFGVCTYADTCSQRPPTSSGSDSLTCTGGKWRLVTTDYPLACPSSPPVDGSPCRCGAHASYPMCSYCGFGPGIGASCDAATGKWTTTAVTCNPPPPPPDGGTDGGGWSDASSGEVGAGHG